MPAIARDSRPAASAYTWSYASRPVGSAPARSALNASGSSQMASTMSAGKPALRRHMSRHTLHVVPSSRTRCSSLLTRPPTPGRTGGAALSIGDDRLLGDRGGTLDGDRGGTLGGGCVGGIGRRGGRAGPLAPPGHGGGGQAEQGEPCTEQDEAEPAAA